MNRRYAADTVVGVDRTQVEIHGLLAKHGATARAVGVDESTGRASIMFVLSGRQIRVEVLLPTNGPPTSPPRGWYRWTDAQRQRWTTDQREKLARSTWRGLLLLLRAKLEAIEGGYSSVEHEFLADVLLPDGQTVGQLVMPAVKKAYLTGGPTKLLPEA